MMNVGRIVLMITCLGVAGLAVWFALAAWDQANRVATVTSALGAVAAVGVAIWAALHGNSGRRSLTVADTGNATVGAGGRAITGVQGNSRAVSGPVQISRTGDGRVSGDGDAVTGAQLD